MVFTQDRPIPAPRLSLLDRKPPVPKRSLKPTVVPKPRTTLSGKAKPVPDFPAVTQKNVFSIRSSFQTSSKLRNLENRPRRTRSLPDVLYVRKSISANPHRPYSLQFSPSTPENYPQFESKINGKEGQKINEDGMIEGDMQSSLERGRVARIAKFLDSRLLRSSGTFAPTTSNARFNVSIEPIARTSTISLSSGSSYHSSSAAADRSNNSLPRLDTFEDSAAGLSSGLNDSAGNGVWNPSYVPLGDIQRRDDASTSSSYAISFDSLDRNYWGNNFEDPLGAAVKDNARGGEKSDANIAHENVYLNGWAQVHLNKKDRGKLWVVIEKDALACWTNEDEEGGAEVGPYFLKNLIYVGKNPSTNTVELHVRENVQCNHWTNLKLAMESDKVENWVLNIAKCIMPKNELLLYSLKSITAGGCVWIRQGTACAWASGWMYVSEHRLYYVLDSCSILFELDIRKFIGMKSNVSKVDWCASVVGSTKGPFLLLQEGGSLFVQAEHDSATFTWIELLKHQMECSSHRLEDCKLTADDVPVIVDKCIKFISTYGLFQQGLYRRNGSTIEVRLLLNEFRKDPMNVHIVPESDDMVNVVADVLRSFFRQLDSPLVPHYIQERLFAVADIKNVSRLDEYHEILMGLPRIRLQTLRRVLDHLKDVTEHAYANLATTENVAKVFGPTLFSVEQDPRASKMDSNFAYTIQQVNLVKDLLIYYTSIFRISAREMSIKSKMNMLQEHPTQVKARADGFLVPVHILEKDNHTFNVQSSSTAEQVCEAARNRPVIRNEVDINNFALFEEIKRGQLERRVNTFEKMSSMVTGRWLDWDPTECYLLFKRDSVPFSFRLSYPFADDIRIAEPGAKSFNVGHLKLEGGLVIHYNKSLKKLNEWPTDDILWYMGHESGRKPPYSYTLTFIMPKLSSFKYKSKYMGYCIAFRENTQRTQWFNAVISSQQDFHDASSTLVQI